jgi:hypothetical protein
MASATASMPKNQADRLPLSHQSNPQGLMISIDTRGAFFLMLQSQRGSIPGRILTSDRNRYATLENRSILTIQKQA